MKGLAIDSSVTKLTIACKNDDHIVTVSYDIGMKQSETLLPAISYVMEKADLIISDLDYTTICKGPGSFTGLRLGFAALKAFETAGKIPLYGISTLKANAYANENLGMPVISIIDAKKYRFYACSYKNGTEIFPESDYTYEKLASFIKKSNYYKFLLSGPVPDMKVFCEEVSPLLPGIQIRVPKTCAPVTDALFALTEKMIQEGEKPLLEYDGPVYLRASEAEEKLGK